MKSEIEICICIRWTKPTIDSAWRDSEVLLDWYSREALLSSAPLHWNFACYPFLEKRNQAFREFYATLTNRIDRNRDSILPMGYSGALLPLLSLCELEKEVSWSLTNPWGSGIRDIFGQSADFFMPASTCETRKKTLEITALNGFTGICVPMNSVSYNDSGLKPDIRRLQQYAYFEASKHSVTEIQQIYKTDKNPALSVLFLVFDTNFTDGKNVSTAPIDAIKCLFDSIARKHSIKFVTLASLTKSLPGIGAIGIDSCPNPVESNTPVARRVLYELTKLRKHAGNDDDSIRRILEAIPARETDSEKKKAKSDKIRFPGNDRTTIADMQGNAILTGDEYDVCFNEGKFVDFVVGNAGVLAGKKAKSYISIDGSELDLHQVSASSTEGEITRGLRVTSEFRIPNEEDKGSQITDYFFTEGFRALIVSTLIRYPVLTNHTYIERIVPIEPVLFLIKENEKVTITTHCAGEKMIGQFNASQRKSLIHGNYFVMSGENLSMEFGFLGKHSLATGCLEISVCPDNVRKSPYFMLAINPFGTYHRSPSDFFSGKTESISFFFGLVNEDSTDPPTIPRAVLAELP